MASAPVCREGSQVALFSRGLFGEPGFECIEIGVDVDAEGLLQPRQEAGLQQVEGGRHALGEFGELPLEQRQRHQQQREQRQSGEHDDHHGAGGARQPVPFQPVDQRIEDVGQQGAGQKGREDGAEQVDQSARDEQDGECKPGDVERADR